METANHILNILRALANDPTARMHLLACACAATLVVAIIRDAVSVRSRLSQRKTARITPPIRKIRSQNVSAHLTGHA